MHARHKNAKHLRTTAAATMIVEQEAPLAATARQISCFANGVTQTGTVQTSQCASSGIHKYTSPTSYTHHHFLTHPSSISQVQFRKEGKKTKRFARVVFGNVDSHTEAEECACKACDAGARAQDGRGRSRSAMDARHHGWTTVYRSFFCVPFACMSLLTMSSCCRRARSSRRFSRICMI